MRRLVLLAAAALIGGCGGAGTKAGGDVAPVTLTMGAPDAAGVPESRQLDEFARRVRALSGGRMRIEPRYSAGGPGGGFDEDTARLVIDGRLDMAVIPARTWDTQGVTSLRAFNAPFLVTSDELLDAIVTSRLAGEMLQGLRRAGVVGLALVPDGLRHPFGFHGMLGGPGDYHGTVIRVPTSRTVVAYFRALGATVTDADKNAGTQDGMESGYLQRPTGTATGNVVFSAKANAVVIGRAAYDELDEGQRRILARAAVQTRDWAIDTAPTDDVAARSYCSEGGSVGGIPEVDIRALRRAGAPVYAELERDPQTRDLIKRIRTLRDRIGAPELGHDPGACGRAQGPGPAPVHGHTPIDGVYRYELTEALLRRAGVTDHADIVENRGLFTWRLSKGGYCWKQKAPTPVFNPDECSDYSLDGDRLTLGYPDGTYEIYGVTRRAGGDLDLRVIQAIPGQEAGARVFALVRWRRVGDA